jgi:serine/threonine protein kinase
VGVPVAEVPGMTETPVQCLGCERKLDPEDQFCSKCGVATEFGGGADALDSADEPGSSGNDREVTIADETPTSAPPSGINFIDRVRHVLGAEFELLSLLGQGGFARVYLARDCRLDRIVAIKVIQPDLIGNELFMESFRNEGVALAKLRHPGIVPIYNIHERGGLIYYIMPFVEGTTLEERLNRGRLPPFESRRILIELTDALASAHKAKMVHLDIKPENVFLEGDLQKALLLDFGIAIAVAESVPDSGGPVIGTPSYMSPEQAKGLPDIDHRSDIYSLGALAYRMIMGRPPYLVRNIEEAVEKHEAETPVPIRDINPTIPKDFADAVMKCLEKDPWKRFSTAKELGGALQMVTFSSGRETASHEVSSEGPTRNTLAILAGAALLIGVVIGQALG